MNDIESAFEAKTGLSVKSSPSLFKLMAHSFISKGYDIKSGEINMVPVASLRSKLSFFDKAVKEVLRKGKNSSGTPLIEFVKDDTDFNQMILGITKKYLNFYESEDDVYDIVMTAFSKIFLENFKKSFNDFDGWVVHNDGSESKVAIEPWIHTILKRAVITESKNFSKIHKNTQEVTPFEDETHDEALDREVNKNLRNMDKQDKMLYEEMVRELKRKFKRDRNPERVEKIFDLLVAGYQKQEIAKELGISSTRVGDYVWQLKSFAEELAKDFKMQGDSQLMDLLDVTFRKKKKAA